MLQVLDMECCGARELNNLSQGSVENSLKEFVEDYIHEYGPSGIGGFRYVVFSQAGAKSHYGDDFTKLIKKHKLGRVQVTRMGANPNTDNPLKLYVWTINHRGIMKYYKETDPKGYKNWYADRQLIAQDNRGWGW